MKRLAVPIQKTWLKKRRFFAAAVFGIVIASAPLTDVLTTSDEIYPGTTVGIIKLGGMTAKNGTAALEQYFSEFLEQQLIFSLENQQTALPLNDILTFDIKATINNAMQIGHQNSITQTIKQRLGARLFGVAIDPIFIIKHDYLISALKKSFPEYSISPQDAKFDFIFEKNKPPVISILAEQSGKDINADAMAQLLGQRAVSFSNAPIIVRPKRVGSTITRTNLEKLLPAAQKLFELPPPEIKSKNQKWIIAYPVLASWITARNTPTGLDEEQIPALHLNKERVTEWLDDIAKQITKNPKDAEFELSEDGKKVVKFAMAENGLALPRDQNIALIAASILKGETSELILQPIAPKILNTSAAEAYGIRELVGQGSTNFAGSPPNRIKNIARGAELLNGELIEPGEEFSLLEHLRPFTIENKYLSELVIKAAEGKTVPEIGGGLCQIGTTMFRAVLNAGLPVTFRRNHSYRVSYYEPPVGMDATIYDPWPDFKFINDTGNRLLLTTEIVGANITFKLWGTKDGREIKMTEPEIFNLKKPPEKKIIETLDLPPGKTKCTERAHTGADAKFTYTIISANGEIKETEFFSHYQPWQEVCLLGVTSLSVPETTAETNTPAVGTSEISETLPSADIIGVSGDAEN